mgnify:CR=1 FL=1
MLNRLLFMSACALALSLQACIIPGGELACDPGRSTACVCAGGASGAQVCKGDGSGYEACVCDTCQAGDVRACDCADGTTGTRSCDTAEDGFGPCQCSSQPPSMDMNVAADMSSQNEDMGHDMSAGVDMEMAPDLPTECVEEVSSVCDAETPALRWVDSCGVPFALIQFCLGGCASEDQCETAWPTCDVPECDSICGLFDPRAISAYEMRPAVRDNPPHMPRIVLPEGYPIDVYLREEGDGMWGGVFEVTTSRVAITRDVPVRFVTGGAEAPVESFAQACSSVHNVAQGTYLLELGPTDREVIRLVLSPPIN